jgi:hypothetical protein
MACPNHLLLQGDAAPAAPDYDRIARRIGMKLREMYGAPEAPPLPAEHVDLLLRLRQKEREQTRLTTG